MEAEYGDSAMGVDLGTMLHRYGHTRPTKDFRTNLSHISYHRKMGIQDNL